MNITDVSILVTTTPHKCLTCANIECKCLLDTHNDYVTWYNSIKKQEMTNELKYRAT